ncbi:MAG: acyltransferase family protein [Armatimonadota bacterium]|jgi:predicted acyltransferase
METPAEAGQQSGRLESLDIFRGATIAGMLLVNNAGDWDHVFGPLRHAEWHGCTATDLIFPFFLFIMGTSMALSFAKRRARGAGTRELLAHTVRRSLLLVLLGLALNALAYLAFRSEYLRYPGVLQRIGVCYLLASLLFLFHGTRGILVWTGVLLAGYWAMMTLIPVPGFGRPDLSQQGNLASWLDSAVFGPHCYIWDARTGAGHDPEGLLSTLPAVGTTLLGCLAGVVLRDPRAAAARRVSGLMLAGAALTAGGLFWSLAFPLNKNLWTSSYVLFTAGCALLALGALHLFVDVLQQRAWGGPLRVYGLNPITAYVGASAMAYCTILIRLPSAAGESIPLKKWVYQTLYASWIPGVASEYWSSAAYGFTYVVVWCALMWLLYRRRIFIRI